MKTIDKIKCGLKIAGIVGMIASGCVKGDRQALSAEELAYVSTGSEPKTYVQRDGTRNYVSESSSGVKAIVTDKDNDGYTDRSLVTFPSGNGEYSFHSNPENFDGLGLPIADSSYTF